MAHQEGAVAQRAESEALFAFLIGGATILALAWTAAIDSTVMQLQIGLITLAGMATLVVLLLRFTQGQAGTIQIGRAHV